MKILWVCAGLMPEAAEASGYDSKVYGGGWTSALLAHLIKLSSENQFFILSLDYRKCDVSIGNVRHVSFGEKGKFNYSRQRRKIEEFIHDKIKEFRPDIIHIHGTEYYYGCLSSYVYENVPTVVSIQGIISEYYIHYDGGLNPEDTWWTNISLRLIKDRYTISHERNRWKFLRSGQEQKTMSMHSNFIGRTEWDRANVYYYNNAAKYYHGDETLRSVFYDSKRDESKIIKHSVYCGAAAGYPLKGVHYLLKAIACLKNEYSDIQLRIAASDGELGQNRTLMQRIKGYPYGAYLRKLIRDLDLSDNVVALPRLSAPEVVAELERAELFVLPSLCENSPNSLGEAMLVGTPAIATCAGGTSSILKDGVEGRLVPTYSAAALAYAIKEAFDNPLKARQMAKKARETALRRHDGKTNAMALLNIYSDIIEDCRKRK